LVWRLFQKLKIELLYDPVYHFWAYNQRNQSANNTGNCKPMFIVATFTTVKLWNQSRSLSIDEWIMKMLYIHTHTHTHNGVLFSHKE
jgi:hypothetical protein